MTDIERLEKNLQQSLAELKDLIARHATKLENNPWLNTDEACRLLRCSPSKLTTLRKNGHIKHTGKGLKGETILHSRKSIEQYIERQATRNQIIH